MIYLFIYLLIIVFIEVLALLFWKPKVSIAKEKRSLHLTFVTRSACSMSNRRFTVEVALDTFLDNDFSLSDGESSEEEEGDNLHALLGEPVVRRRDSDALTRDLVVGDDNDHSDGDCNDVGDGVSDSPSDVPSFTDPVDPLVSDENVGSSPPS